MRKNKINYVFWGVVSVLVWVVVSAFSRVFTADLDQIVDPFVLCFFVFIISNIIYLAFNIVHLKELFNKVNGNFRDVIWVNLTTFCTWFFVLYPLKYIEPSIVSTITLSIAPLSTLIIGQFIYKKTKIYFSGVLVFVMLFLAIGYIILLVFIGETSVQLASIEHNIISIIFSVIVGLSTAANAIYSKRLNDHGFRPIDTLTIRYVLLLIISGILTLAFPHKIPQWNPHLSWEIFLDAMTLVVIPVYFFYIGIRYLEPITVIILCPLMPVLVYFLEFFDKRMHPNLLVLVGVLTVLLLTTIGSVICIKHERVKHV